MRFRLTYEGQLQAGGGREHKHELRKRFHEQLRHLWSVHPGLRMLGATGDLKYSFPKHAPKVAWLAEHYERFGYAFVPLVLEEQRVYCSIDILMLRPDLPGTLIRSADLDNRVKTILDALRIPSSQSELGKSGAPDASEIPFFCLLEDDKLVSHLAVEADTLLDPIPETKHPENDVRLLITVEIRPYILQTGNMHF